MMTRTVQQLEELDELASQLLELAGERRVFTFDGPVGAGKTTFIQAICRQLGVTEAVSSPTFALVNEYAGPVYHLDLYRLEHIEEALDIGIEDLLYDPFYCVIEWPQIIEDLLPEDSAKIEIEISGENSRKMLIL